MAIHEPLESLAGETYQAEPFVPFSLDDIKRLRTHILLSSGAFDDEAIAEQVYKDTEACLLSKCVTIEVVQNREIDSARIASSMEKEPFNDVNLLAVSFYEFLGIINKVNDNLEALAIESNKKKIELFKKLEEELFPKDPIMISLKFGLGELRAGRSIDGVSTKETSQTILSLERAIMAQRAVLVGINYPELCAE